MTGGPTRILSWPACAVIGIVCGLVGSALGWPLIGMGALVLSVYLLATIWVNL